MSKRDSVEVLNKNKYSKEGLCNMYTRIPHEIIKRLNEG